MYEKTLPYISLDMKYMLLYVYVFMYLAHEQLDSLSKYLPCNKTILVFVP